MGTFKQTSHEQVFQDSQLTVFHDGFTFPDGTHGARTVAVRPRAVAAVALNAHQEVALLHQWRAPLQGYLYELPAGKLDHDNEDPLVGMARELAEEAQLKADQYTKLTTLDMSAGWSNEVITIYMATGLHPAPIPEQFVLEAEEADMTLQWVPLNDALAMVTDGRITDAKTVVGLLLADRHLH
ncbi:NUDIX hydrolase [Stomatohabitans albus]|uniref:NUDIX hydrolase n=1 Tax=Stomatohabitans albus TaxID=3110766 RepID=UPI00300D75AF